MGSKIDRWFWQDQFFNPYIFLAGKYDPGKLKVYFYFRLHLATRVKSMTQSPPPACNHERRRSPGVESIDSNGDDDDLLE